ncbi:hypothetical protein AAHN97_06410 [Chitinophaga niabensis]|uniref:hypothetical protein n=1 Tax=Chitinophaga niabensis TaxID=536979 RepID=UPI0031BB62A5
MSVNLFENFERFIHYELSQKIEALPWPPPVYYKSVTEIIEQDSRRIFKRINSVKVTTASRKKAAWLIQSFQEKVDNLLGTLGYFMEKISFTIDDTPISDSWHALVMEIIAYLREIMDLLISRHPDLFDIDQVMSDVMEMFFVKETREKISDQLELLQEGTACYEAYKLLLLPIEEPENEFVYRHIFYYQALIKDTTSIIRREVNDAEKAGSIRQLLWKLNFNHPRYVAMIREEYLAYLDNSQGKERIKKCLELRKNIKLNRSLSGAQLYFLGPSLEKQCETWINTELSCIRALMVTESIITTNPFAEFKVKTKLSLPQIAGLLRLFLNEDRRELVRFMARYFVTISGQPFTPAALTRSYDKNKGKSLFQQLKSLFEQKER